jgi:hypothetical protein
MDLLSCGAHPRIVQSSTSGADRDFKGFWSPDFDSPIDKLPANAAPHEDVVDQVREALIEAISREHPERVVRVRARGLDDGLDDVIDLVPLAVVEKLSHLAVDVWEFGPVVVVGASHQDFADDCAEAMWLELNTICEVDNDPAKVVRRIVTYRDFRSVRSESMPF